MNSLRAELWRLWTGGNYAPVTRRVNATIEQMEVRIGRMTGKPQKNGKLDKFYFVSCPISEEDMPEIDGAYPTPESVWDALTGFIAEGLKVSFAVNAKNDMTICSLTDRREESASFGACLTGGADGWYDALRVTAYKYTALLHGELGAEGTVGKPTSRII